MAVTTTHARQAIAAGKDRPGKVGSSLKVLRKNGVCIGTPATREDTVAIAALKQLRALVLNELQTVGVHTVLGTGPTEGVGETSTSINLACSIARLPNWRALLIDLDLPGSSVQARSGISFSYCSERIGAMISRLCARHNILAMTDCWFFRHLIDSAIPRRY